MTSQAFAALAASARRLLKQTGIPGAAVGVILGRRRFAFGLGVTSVEEPRPVSPATLFQIGSITKTVTATLALRLCDEGKLALDRPVRTWLPGLRFADRAVARRLTLRHLLTHTGGWAGDYFDDTGRGDDALERMTARLAFLPQQTPLGEVWSYNNSGFYLVGRLIETVTGLPYEEAVRKRLFDRLAMTASFFFADEAMARSFAMGHNIAGRAASVARPWAMSRSAHPVGGISASVEDVLRFAASQMRGGFLRPRTMREAWTPQTRAGCGVDSMGLGWMLSSAGGIRTVWHGGVTNGHVSLLTLVPSRGFAVAVLTNANTGGAYAARVTRQALKAVLGVEEKPLKELGLARKDLKGYVGRYEAQLCTRELRLAREGLVMRTVTKGGFPTQDSPPLPPPPPVRLAFYAPDRVFLEGAPGALTRGEFLRDAAGRVEWLRVAGRLHARRGPA